MRKTQNTIPDLRFPNFEETWKIKKLEEIGFIVNKKNSNNDSMKVLTNSAIDGIVDQEEYFEKQIANKKNLKNYYVAEKDDFIYNPRISNYAPVGPFNRNNLYRGVLSPLYTIVRFENGNLSFIEHYLESTFWFKYLKSVANYGARHDRMNITIDNFLKLPIPFPSLPEQKRIAHFFTTLDTKIKKLEEKKSALEEYKKGMMQKLFSQEIRFKDEEGNDYPDWEEKRFGEIFKFLTTNSYSRSKLNYSKTGVWNIHYGDIHTKYSSRFNLLNENVPVLNNEIDMSKFNQENFCQVGDLVIADASEDYSDIGKSIELVSLNGEKVLSGLHTILARPTKSITSTGFLGYMMQCQDIRKQIMIIAQGSKVLGLSKNELKKVIINLPSVDEQQKIANFLSKIDDKINNVSEQIESTKEYKKGLLQRMFVN